ncbi:HAMP domain-containing sensor histidine kinase [uncultured Thermanaerothrix sp.]|uniref:sensor histidine kinase n=1 Tax=uncultured Thermanaerothrix sp. TaxID=1195149 RepID=UPI002629427D|nr:HAMP domain-containing sensor histidine kinase [uncultured Thermanaerothrix sp.]
MRQLAKAASSLKLDLMKDLPVSWGLIQTEWIERTVRVVGQSASTRENLHHQVREFVHASTQILKGEAVDLLDPILAQWASSLTQTDLESTASDLMRFMSVLVTSSLEALMIHLTPLEALAMFRALLPCFNYAYERLAQHEIEAKITYISNRLNEVQQRLERLDKSKSDFIAIAAHELKTPLTLIEGYTAMLREGLHQQDANTAEFSLLLDGIENGARRLRGLIEDMIDVSLIDNQLLSLNFQPIWLNHLFAILERELQPAIEERRQILQIHDFPGSHEVLMGDPERLLQAFRNLLNNAIKFTPDGGKIEVSGRELPGFVEVTITDTGIGIDPHDQSIIFEKFSRVGNVALHSSGKTKFKGGGPGLGLPIAKGIIEAHGGTIWVESEGHDEIRCPGSTFHILIPKRHPSLESRVADIFASFTQPQSPSE